jgi:hypothetical protein
MRRNERVASMNLLGAPKRLYWLAALLAGLLFIALLAAPSADAQCAHPSAKFGVCKFSTSMSSTQAGAHADYSTSFSLNTNALGNPVGQLKNVAVQLPPGEVGNPQAIPQCTDNDFQNFNCPSDAQVGVLNATFIVAPGSKTTLTQPNLAPTTLTASAGPCTGLCNQVTLNVANATGINSGDYLTVCGDTTPPCDTGKTGQAEHVTVVSVSGNTITALPGGPLSEMQFTHDAGDLVYDDTISVASTSGFEGFKGGNKITIGKPGSADYESDTVAFAPGSPTKLDLNKPLKFQHAAGEPAIHLATTESAPIPIFNMQRDPNHAATLAGTLLIATIVVEINVHSPGGKSCASSDCSLTGTLSTASSLLTLEGSKLTLWGVPGDPSHDSQRCGQLGQNCQPSAVTKAPFMTNPTNCSGGPLLTKVTVDSYENRSATSSRHLAAPTGCDLLGMSPTLSVRPDDSKVDTPAGYDFDLKVPQNEQPYSVATPEVKDVSITLPAGTSLSPPVARGLKGCSDAQFAANRCPSASKIGTVSIATPLLADQLTGSVYVGSPTPSQMYRLFIIASADSVKLKLTGQVTADPVTGQLTAVFAQNPELPFDELNLSLSGGPKAALANPDSCGTFTTTSDIAPYSGGPDATPSSSFNITGCATPQRFAPSFHAGVSFTVGGAYTPFALSISRSDQDQYLSGISVKLPKGLLAKLAGVGKCTSAELAHAAASSGAQEKAHPSCPSSSLVGTAKTAAGAGPLPFTLPGKVYLTGPYKGAPYGLAVVVPAVAGPYDLGTVVVRQALNIDPDTTQVTVVSDPLPQILKGIPLRLRDVQVTLGRKQFVLNPTSCQASRVTGTLTSTQAASAAVSSPFKVGGCAGLAFSPKLAIGLSGKGQTHSGKHPTLTATVTQPAHQANLHRVRVTLPLSLALDPLNTKHVCPYQVAKKVRSGPVPCPASSIVGSASAVTPLLSKPLSGKVYLVQGIKIIHGHKFHTLPTLLVALRGQIALNLRSQTAVVGKGALVSDFKTIPDAPVSKFVLTINGGPKGILVITGNHIDICKKPQISSAQLVAQNGKQRKLSITMPTPCTSGRGRRA